MGKDAEIDLVELLALQSECLRAMPLAKAHASKNAQTLVKRHLRPPFVIAEITTLKLAADVLGGKALMVWLYLVFETRRQGIKTIPVSNVGLAGWGVERRLKYKALDRLERAGLVHVSRMGKRSLRVTVCA
jgi:DNA-binding transcriptional ArsR family regulator